METISISQNIRVFKQNPISIGSIGIILRDSPGRLRLNIRVNPQWFFVSCGLRNTICEIESSATSITTPQLLSYGQADSYCKSIGSKIITIESLKKHWDLITRDLITTTLEDIKDWNPENEFQLDFWTSNQACWSLNFRIAKLKDEIVYVQLESLILESRWQWCWGLKVRDNFGMLVSSFEWLVPNDNVKR